MKCGLLGRKLGHSYSPQIHAHLGKYSYELFQKEPDAVADFLQNGDFTAINVTMPYKKTVMPYCSLTKRAEKLGSVNTIVRQPDGSLLGHNTDYFGFSSMVKRSGLDIRGKKCLVLGSGGASVTAVAVLTELGGQVVVISRSGENNYENLHLHQDAAIVCNCTPVGMYPNTGIAPVDISRLPKLEGVLDVVYNPARTQLLLDAEARGLITMNGLWMLVAQAKEASEWFQGEPLPDEQIETVYNKMRQDMENIVLIGMPGCGKSTVGKLLAQKLGKEFVDADQALEQATGRPIPEIITQDGEEAFRELETQTLAELGKRSGLVIATGGGCVTKQRNYPLLHQNGTLFWLHRYIHLLPTEGRPLSKANQLAQMFSVRRPMYARFADHIVSNNGAPESTVQKILGFWEEKA